MTKNTPARGVRRRSDAQLRDVSTVTFARPDVCRAGNCHESCWRVPLARTALHRFLDRELAHDGERFYEETHGAAPPVPRR
jgi:hypothetical protein